MGEIIQLKDTSKEIENCHHKKDHESINYACPGCQYVGTHLRKNMVQNGETYIIDYEWSTYNRSGCYKTFDGRNEGGAWDDWKGNALLNKHFQLLDRFNGKFIKTR